MSIRTIEAPGQIDSHPLRGELFETFVVIEFLKHRFNSGRLDNLYFLRDRTGNEVDLIVDTGSGPVPVEIKSAQTVTESFLKGLKAFQKLEPDTPGAFLILGGSVSQNRQVAQVRGFSELSEVFGKIDAKVV